MKKGFTLIELLSVIVILGIISVIAVPTIIGVIDKARLNALKDSAYGLIEASNLYYIKNQNGNNIRFDISDNNVLSSDTTNKLNYKGSIKEGTSIIKSNGQVVVCVTDGKNSAYKNYNESKVSLVSSKKCTIPDNSSVVYLDGEASIDDTNVSELLDRINQLETRLNEYATKSELSQVNTNLSSNITANTTSINQLNSNLSDLNSSVSGITARVDSQSPQPAVSGQEVELDVIRLKGNKVLFSGLLSVNYKPTSTQGHYYISIHGINVETFMLDYSRGQSPASYLQYHYSLNDIYTFISSNSVNIQANSYFRIMGIGTLSN